VVSFGTDAAIFKEIISKKSSARYVSTAKWRNRKTWSEIERRGRTKCFE